MRELDFIATYDQILSGTIKVEPKWGPINSVFLREKKNPFAFK